MKQITVYYIDTFEIDEILDNLVGLARHPRWDWAMWNFHCSMQMNNDTFKLISINLKNDWDENAFINVIKWCEKHHNNDVEDRPEDYMGFELMTALCYAGLLPEGTYLVEASW